MRHFRTEIILIGPPRVGKTTIANLLGKLMELKVVSLDLGIWDEFRSLRYDNLIPNTIGEKNIQRAKFRYWKTFEIKLVERCLSQYSNCIFDFGAGHCVYFELVHKLRLERLFKRFNNIVTILPFPEYQLSKQFLQERCKSGEDLDFFMNYIDTYRSLSNKIIYTYEKTPLEICETILQ